MQGVNIFNKKKDCIALLEMDEVTCDETIPLINLKYLIVTNLFRDSMQRNANPDYVYNKLQKGLNKDITLILNSDDPFSSMLGEKNKNKCVYFGIDKLDTDKKVSNNLINDFLVCPKCSSNLKYDYIVVNISEGINKPWSIMGRCSNVYISDSGDYIENCRFNNLKRYFIESGKEAIVDRMMRINLKMKDTMDEGFLKRIMYTDAYGYVSSLLDMV